MSRYGHCARLFQSMDAMAENTTKTTKSLAFCGTVSCCHLYNNPLRNTVLRKRKKDRLGFSGCACHPDAEVGIAQYVVGIQIRSVMSVLDRKLHGTAHRATEHRWYQYAILKLARDTIDSMLLRDESAEKRTTEIRSSRNGAPVSSCKG